MTLGSGDLVVALGSGDLGKCGLREVVTLGSADFGKW